MNMFRSARIRIRLILLTVASIVFGWILNEVHRQSSLKCTNHAIMDSTNNSSDRLSPLYYKPETAPYLFVGGHPSSGTSLLRVLLDVHPMIRCGSETYLLVPFLNQYEHLKTDAKHLTDIGVMPYALDNATAMYIMNIVNRMGKPAPILCHKQSLDHEQILNLAKFFPSAKFVTIVRDGRSVTESIIRRGFDKVSFNKEDANRGLRTWEHRTRQFINHCQLLGQKRCLCFRYEELIIHTEVVMRRILAFLNTSWDPIVLEHHKHIGQIEGITTHEKHQRVQQNVDMKSLTKWYGGNSHLPNLLQQQAHLYNKLLQELGYASIGLPPDYTKLNFTLPLITSD